MASISDSVGADLFTKGSILLPEKAPHRIQPAQSAYALLTFLPIFGVWVLMHTES